MDAKLPGLKTNWLGKSFVRLEEVGSTNEYLKSRAKELPDGFAVVADRQTSGKGRLGRVWRTGKDSLALSFLVRGVESERISALPLVAGLAVFNALHPVCGDGLALKWSNDLIFNGKKICGVLCESRISSNGAFAVAGVGINISQTQSEFDGLGLVYATSLKLATGKTAEILELSASILNNFEPIFEIFLKYGFHAVRDEYKERCATIGRRVSVTRSGKEISCVAVDVDGDGGLVCESESERFAVYSGEAVMSGIYGKL